MSERDENKLLNFLDTVSTLSGDLIEHYKSLISTAVELLEQSEENLDAVVNKIAQKLGQPYEGQILNMLNSIETTVEESAPEEKLIVSEVRPFIVHGHDSAALFELKDLLQNDFGFQEPISLQQQAPGGKTLIELFEDYASKATVVFVLLTGDDPCLDESGEEILLPRQNVTFEFGYFVGALGRLSGKVIVLRKGKVKMPSDVKGWRYIDVTNGIKAAYAEIKNALTQTTIIK
ncbi:MAG: nucleotide-binding protein [Cytophagales bacterium]|nr:nucleotide-binding protein [Cytophagales bacterium]